MRKWVIGRPIGRFSAIAPIAAIVLSLVLAACGNSGKGGGY